MIVTIPSAYIPPEAVYVDPARGIACVKSEANKLALHLSNANDKALLLAHESFDVW
jgi:hypothetical protein